MPLPTPARATCRAVCQCVLVCGASVGKVWDDCGVLSDPLTPANCVRGVYYRPQNMGLKNPSIPRSSEVSPQGREP
jgi:hypothetical protein